MKRLLILSLLFLSACGNTSSDSDKNKKPDEPQEEAPESPTGSEGDAESSSSNADATTNTEESGETEQEESTNNDQNNGTIAVEEEEEGQENNNSNTNEDEDNTPEIVLVKKTEVFSKGAGNDFDQLISTTENTYNNDQLIETRTTSIAGAISYVEYTYNDKGYKTSSRNLNSLRSLQSESTYEYEFYDNGLMEKEITTTQARVGQPFSFIRKIAEYTDFDQPELVEFYTNLNIKTGYMTNEYDENQKVVRTTSYQASNGRVNSIIETYYKDERVDYSISKSFFTTPATEQKTVYHY